MKETKYQEIASTISRQIHSGQLKRGTKLPSIRDAAGQFSVSINTIKRVYQVLEDWRLVTVRPKAGYFVSEKPAQRLLMPRTQQTSDQAFEVKTSIPVRLNASVAIGPDPTLGPAVQSPKLMPTALINKLTTKVMKQFSDRCHSYAAPPGSLELRQAIARRMFDIGIEATEDNIVITSGAKEAVFLSIKAVTGPGDVVAVESPAYYALLEVLRALGLKAVEIASDASEGINLQQLEHCLKKFKIAAVAVSGNYSNPIGCTIPDWKKQALCQLIAKHNVPLVEDDVYGDLCFCPPRPKAIKSFDRNGLVMYCGSFSKTISPGLRLGWSIAGKAQKEIELLKLVVNQTTSMIPQLVVAEFLETGAYDRHLRGIQSQLASQSHAAVNSIEKHFPADTRLSAPEGGHVLWLELNKDVKAKQLYEDLLDRGVQIAPGPIFSATGGFGNFIRVNTGFPWTEQLDRQIQTIAQMLP